MNGATCNDQVNTHSCACAAGYTGYMCETGNLESWISVFILSSFAYSHILVVIRKLAVIVIIIVT